MSDRDYYEILGLTPTADGTMVDQAYWHLARKYQGLAATNPRAQYLLDELNEAYGVLGTPRLREQYDAFRDDVLIRKGMVKPVKAKPHAAARKAAEQSSARTAPRLRLPNVPNARTYTLSGVIVALALAGAWQGVNVLFVLAALGIGLALSLTPAVTNRLSGIQFSMPTMPPVSMPQMPQMPQIQTPRLSMPSLPEIQVPQMATGAPVRDETMDADELRASTAATIARWRASVGLKAPAVDATPSNELVDIVESEREVDTDGEPLNAVMEILRGSHRGTGAPR